PAAPRCARRRPRLHPRLAGPPLGGNPRTARSVAAAVDRHQRERDVPDAWPRELLPTSSLPYPVATPPQTLPPPPRPKVQGHRRRLHLPRRPLRDLNQV
uniref:Uncharacterized protein n=1 Tax=Aegilops tauschii subsp. strangulata TaxID=200361 RepID=A0A453MD73_AEGTS